MALGTIKGVLASFAGGHWQRTEDTMMTWWWVSVLPRVLLLRQFWVKEIGKDFLSGYELTLILTNLTYRIATLPT